jgi:hypothetical protein
VREGYAALVWPFAGVTEREGHLHSILAASNAIEEYIEK